MKRHDSVFATPADAVAAAEGALLREDFVAAARCFDASSIAVVLSDIRVAQLPWTADAMPHPRRTDASLSKDSSDLTVFARLLEWSAPRAQIERQVAAGEIDPVAAAKFCTPHPRVVPLVVLGTVETGQLAHVLGRRGLANRHIADADTDERALIRHFLFLCHTVEVIHCARQDDSTWRIIADVERLFRISQRRIMPLTGRL